MSLPISDKNLLNLLESLLENTRELQTAYQQHKAHNKMRMNSLGEDIDHTKFLIEHLKKAGVK